MDLLAIGEVMAEIRQGDTDAFSVGFAGDTYNTAVYCARALGGRHRVGYMTRIGTDPLSLALRAKMDGEGIEASAVVTDPDRNLGIYSVSTDDTGERSFHYWRDRSAARTLFADENDLNHLDRAPIVYLSGITLAIVSPDARHRMMDRLSALSDTQEVSVAYDSNYRPKLWESHAAAQAVTERMWTIADIALPSIDDEMALFGETGGAVLTRFAKRQWRACAIKRGEAGPCAPHFTGALPAFDPAAHVVDTTAAGDSFNGAYLAALIEGRNEGDRLMAGHELARAVVGFPGAIGPQG